MAKFLLSTDRETIMTKLMRDICFHTLHPGFNNCYRVGTIAERQFTHPSVINM